jgi:hypothetical protein
MHALLHTTRLTYFPATHVMPINITSKPHQVDRTAETKQPPDCAHLHSSLARKVDSICHVQRSGYAADVTGPRVGDVQMLLRNDAAADAAAAAAAAAADAAGFISCVAGNVYGHMWVLQQ